MLPMTDFQFAFCGLATVAATLGYACARRAAISLASTKESKADVEAGPTEERSLKRKLDESDEGESDAEEQSRPMKRSKTPPADQQEDDEDEWEVVVAPPPPPYEVAVGLQHLEPPVQHNCISSQETVPSEQEAPTVQEHTPPTGPESVIHLEEKGAKVERCSTPKLSSVDLSANAPETPPARPVTPPKPIVPAAATPTNAFSAFSGSRSPFASYTYYSGTSPFALSGQVVRTTPAWRRDSDSTSDVLVQASPANALAPSSPNHTPSVVENVSSPKRNVLESAHQTPSLTKSVIYLTGEEEEVVVADLRGAKLFIKRGDKEFTDGMYGHIKILRRKSTQSGTADGSSQQVEAGANAPTRLLFRRDPLGQVSMNVSLNPTIRCNFDSMENILRVVLMEQAAVDGKPKDEVVVYALKPGRAVRADFQTFAKTLCDQEGFKSGPVTTITSSTSTSTDDAVAS